MKIFTSNSNSSVIFINYKCSFNFREEMEETNEIFIYRHDERDFIHVTSEAKKKELAEVIQNPSVEEVENALTEAKYDGVLVLDAKNSRWLLSFGSHVGIVAQRTARRQADSIARSGYQIPKKYRIKANYPLEELSETNIGELWKTVQQKYVKSTLSGLELDETGIPSQIAERAKLLEGSGHKDELTDAQQEKLEAEARKRAMARSGITPAVAPVKAPSEAMLEEKKTMIKPSKTTVEKKNQKFKIDVDDEEEEIQPKTTKKKKTTKKTPAKKTTTKKKTVKSLDNGPYFFEIDKIKQYVEEEKTTFSTKGVLHIDDDEVRDSVVVFRVDNIKDTQWDKTVMFLEEGDIVEIEVETRDNVHYVTSVTK
jgi:hypothetical protein